MTPRKPKHLHKPRGRKSEFRQATADSICQYIAEGLSVQVITKKKTMPAIATIYRWLDTFPIFQEQYTRARLRRADSRADKIDTITDQLLSGEVPPDVARVAIAAIQWQASKENRDLYGDRQTIRHEDAGDMAERLGSARDRADNVVDIKTVKNKA